MPRQNREKEAISHESKVNAGGSLDGGSGIGAIFQRVERAIAKRQRTISERFSKRLPIGLAIFPKRFAIRVPIGLPGGPAKRIAIRVPVGFPGRSAKRISIRFAERSERLYFRFAIGHDDWFANGFDFRLGRRCPVEDDDVQRNPRGPFLQFVHGLGRIRSLGYDQCYGVCWTIGRGCHGRIDRNRIDREYNRGFSDR